jgi:hypothetical protein
MASTSISLHLVQIVTCSTVDVETWLAFNSSILAIKLTFSDLRQEIESLQDFSSLVNFFCIFPSLELEHILASQISHFP